MEIFILEDDPIQRHRLEKIIKEALEKSSILYKKIFATARPVQLLNEINSIGNHHIYFLDLEINNHLGKGLEIAQLIREKDPYGTIVFVTTHSELAPKTFAYKVSALDFIEKDQSDFEFRKRIEECLIIANQYQQKPISEDSFIFENKYTKFQIPFSEILYFETSEIPHKINLVTSKKNISFYGKLSDIVKMDGRLFSCHKSFVVNIPNIISVDKKNKLVYFNNGMFCFVSRRLLKEVENKIEELSVKKF
ncbi:response regulator transcription factor [Turicibacter sanguinis]|uniref:response regulator transcription factor n=1 Tax=Turicibacter sanguinis TaxID=154288 RepID=UPI0018AAE7FA|nr:response regulator transcription factor [Turicibacter sanguinis]MDB8565241.1 response regulator transcription factor [Turicibacter sanguinis]